MNECVLYPPLNISGKSRLRVASWPEHNIAKLQLGALRNHAEAYTAFEADHLPEMIQRVKGKTRSRLKQWEVRLVWDSWMRHCFATEQNRHTGRIMLDHMSRCLKQSAYTGWERQFLRGLVDRINGGGRLTGKQINTINTIWIRRVGKRMRQEVAMNSSMQPLDGLLVDAEKTVGDSR